MLGKGPEHLSLRWLQLISWLPLFSKSFQTIQSLLWLCWAFIMLGFLCMFFRNITLASFPSNLWQVNGTRKQCSINSLGKPSTNLLSSGVTHRSLSVPSLWITEDSSAQKFVVWVFCMFSLLHMSYKYWGPTLSFSSFLGTAYCMLAYSIPIVSVCVILSS